MTPPTAISRKRVTRERRSGINPGTSLFLWFSLFLPLLFGFSCEDQGGTVSKIGAEDRIPEHEEPSETPSRKPGNRLVAEKSPYLLQHAHNPVDWFPWGEEAFQKARTEDKPIFLSIGYSTCHWCHVMEEESFSDPDVGRRLNEVFVSIKVDREERPDIDDIYMTVCQLMEGRCGWPLTILMTPDRKPFFTATYIPKESRFGRLGLMELIDEIETLWGSQREGLLESSNKATEVLQRISRPTPGADIEAQILKKAYEQLEEHFDERHGGFGGAPKFPQASTLLFLLRYWKRTGEEDAVRMVEKTLQEMRRGGIYDHLGYGFHRYATDSRWLVPHFEKMLYDQALLAMVYTEAFQAKGKGIYAETAQEIFSYVLRDMKAPEGGFYSAEDADTEGEEGKFYLWKMDEFQRVLGGQRESEWISDLFSLKKAGNFSDHGMPSKEDGQGQGKNILYLEKPVSAHAKALNIPERELKRHMEEARKKLLAERARRVRPYRDDKQLTDWNGIMIASLAKGARVFGRPDYASAAAKAADFILTRVQDDRSGLLHRFRHGESAIPAMINDYAFLVWGLIELYETTFEARYLRSALSLTEKMLHDFWDEENGGFYFVSDKAKGQIVRRKVIQDGALPSGNSVATWNLVRIGRMTGNTGLEKRAAEIGRVFSSQIQRSPSSFCQMMVALEFVHGSPQEVVLVGDAESKETKQMLKALRKRFLPNKIVLLKPAGSRSQEIVKLAGYTRNFRSLQGRTTAYVCMHYLCRQPTTDVETMLTLLEEKDPGQP